NVWNLSPPVRGIAFDENLLRLDDQVWSADRPFRSVAPLARRRHIGEVATRCTAIGPLRNFGDFLVAQRRIVVELLNPDILFDIPWRHDTRFRAKTGTQLHGARPRPGVLIGDERHRRYAIGPVAVLAAALKDWRDVLRERDVADRAGRWSLLRADEP